MHLLNRLFWQYCAKKYNKYFDGPNHILEVGSYDVNGSVRDYFKNFTKYIGVDWRPGPCVDVVCMAHDMDFPFKFDTIITASMLEHDRHWDKSITKMVELLKDDGILLLSWGAALNPPHEHYTADDGGFHSLPAGRVLKFLKSINVHVHEFRYEGRQFKKHVVIKPGRKSNAGMGEVCLVAFKQEPKFFGKPHIDVLVPEDEID
jgi:SAM-dependent methyltransferase